MCALGLHLSLPFQNQGRQAGHRGLGLPSSSLQPPLTFSLKVEECSSHAATTAVHAGARHTHTHTRWPRGQPQICQEGPRLAP